MFERYTEKARRVIFFGRYEASHLLSPYIETEHLLLGLLREDKALTNRFLRSYDAVESIRKQIEGHTTIGEKVSTSVDLPLSNESKRVLAYAGEEAERLGHRFIGTEHLLLGLLREEKSFAAQILSERNVRLDLVREELARQPHESTHGQRKTPSALDQLSPYVSDPGDQTLHPLVGRENELDRLIEILCHFSRKNPVLVGEPGVGKRTIVGELARRMANANIPQSLTGKTVRALDLPALRVLEKDGSWYERMDRALSSASDEGAIFFVNRMHDRPGGISPVASIHITDLLQRTIMAGKVQCISTSTPTSFAKLQHEGHWLAEYFEPIEIAPATEEMALNVLHGVKTVYEEFHNVSYADEAIEHAVRWASKYFKEGYLPGIAVEVIDEAGATAQLKQPAMPEEIVEVQKRINFIVHRMQVSVSNHEFEKARFYSNEERKERNGLNELRKKHKLDEATVNIRREDIQRAVSKLTGTPIETIL